TMSTCQSAARQASAWVWLLFGPPASRRTRGSGQAARKFIDVGEAELDRAIAARSRLGEQFAERAVLLTHGVCILRRHHRRHSSRLVAAAAVLIPNSLSARRCLGVCCLPQVA